MTLGITAAFASANLERYRNVAAAAIATPFIQMHTGDPGVAGTANVSAGSTTRLAAVWAATGGLSTMALSGAIGPWTNGGTTETLTHVSIWTAASGGTFLQSGILTVPQAWVSTNTFMLNTLTLSYTPIAA